MTVASRNVRWEKVVVLKVCGMKVDDGMKCTKWELNVDWRGEMRMDVRVDGSKKLLQQRKEKRGEREKEERRSRRVTHGQQPMMKLLVRHQLTPITCLSLSLFLSLPPSLYFFCFLPLLQHLSHVHLTTYCLSSFRLSQQEGKREREKGSNVSRVRFVPHFLLFSSYKKRPTKDLFSRDLRVKTSPWFPPSLFLFSSSVSSSSLASILWKATYSFLKVCLLNQLTAQSFQQILARNSFNVGAQV